MVGVFDESHARSSNRIYSRKIVVTLSVHSCCLGRLHLHLTSPQFTPCYACKHSTLILYRVSTMVALHTVTTAFVAEIGVVAPLLRTCSSSQN